jgi:asparagine synthase (glutamine-hydrolysing)
MCGICGIFNTNGEPISVNVLREMNNKITHRGPDSEGYWSDSFIGFAHRRLSILDLSSLGHQPMESDNRRFIITFNGEIYNYRTIRKELISKGYSFKSETDTEVLLYAYAEWKEKCLNKLNGMFAFAIYDKKESQLFVARDRYGIKPLYYYFQNNTFLFGSEFKTFFPHPKFKKEICIDALNEYFTFQNIFSDLTLIKNVNILPAGHFMYLNLADKAIKTEKYWDFKFTENKKLKDENEIIEEINHLFRNAVKLQLNSDVEIGSYLSGGLDSGSISAIASQQFKNLKSFTCGFDLNSASGLEMAFDERENAEYLSYLLKTEHYEVVLKAGDMERVMKDLVWHQEDLRVGQSYPNYYISRLASKFVKVVMSGAGGDELFAGYPWRYFSTKDSNSFDEYIDNYYKYWSRLIPDSLKPHFYQAHVYKDIFHYNTKDVFKGVFKNKDFKAVNTPEEYINNSLYFESKTFLHGLLIMEDKLSMAHSLETRLPFLDNNLVDFAMQIPVKFKLKNRSNISRINENIPGLKKNLYYNQTNDGKLILRKALSSILPFTYKNAVKQGFSAPDASWFQGESIDYIRDLLYNDTAKIYDYLRPQTIHQLLDEHFSGRENKRLLIWSLLSFECWLKHVLGAS